MARPTVVDYAWAHPDPHCLAVHGYVGVMRYLSWDASKNLSRAETDALHAAGLWVGLNWEGRGNWSEFSGGASAGQRNGTEAARLCDGLGAPADVPIFVSADYGAPAWQWSTIDAYLRGFAAASGRVVGFYGQGNLADWLLGRGTVRWIWQTNATGWGGISAHAVLRQKIWTTVCGASVDPDVLIGNPADWAWTTESEEDDMTPEQAKTLADTNSWVHVAAASATAAKGLAGKAVMLATDARDRVTALASWTEHGGVAKGLDEIYQSVLGRTPDPKGLAAWTEAAETHTYDEVRSKIAGSAEAKKHRAA